jgi:hypothetical protein
MSLPSASPWILREMLLGMLPECRQCILDMDDATVLRAADRIGRSLRAADEARAELAELRRSPARGE